LAGGGLRGDAGKLLGGCLPAEGLAGAGVEFGGDRGDPLGGVDAQVGALREVLPQQAVGVFVRGPLPGCVWVAVEDDDVRVHSDLFPVAHLRALVPGQRSPQHFGQGFDLRRQCVAD